MLTRLYVESALFLDALKKDQRGVTAIEYAVLAAGIAGLMLSIFTATGDTGDTVGLEAAIQAAFTKITTALAPSSGS